MGVTTRADHLELSSRIFPTRVVTTRMQQHLVASSSSRICRPPSQTFIPQCTHSSSSYCCSSSPWICPSKLWTLKMWLKHSTSSICSLSTLLLVAISKTICAFSSNSTPNTGITCEAPQQSAPLAPKGLKWRKTSSTAASSDSSTSRVTRNTWEKLANYLPIPAKNQAKPAV